MSMLPLFICRVACSAGRRSCSSAGDGDCTIGGIWPEVVEEEEEDIVEGVEPKAPRAEFRL